MKKLFFLVLLLPLLLVSSPAYAQEHTLYQYFLEKVGYFPTLSERAELYNTLWPDTYRGTAPQNTKFLKALNTLPAENGVNTPVFGGSFQTPSTVAFFEDSLAAGISTSDTSFTLVRGTDKHGTALASSSWGVVIDEGTVSEEIILADCTSTACTNATRGISVLTGTSTVSGAAKAHRRGASVKITDAPHILFITNVFKGKQNIENVLRYSASTTPCSHNDDICDKAYIDAGFSSGAADANDTTKGIVERATAAEAASAAVTGDTTAPLTLTTTIATSTCEQALNRVLVTPSDGKLAGTCFDGTESYTHTGQIVLNPSATTTSLTFAANATSTILSTSTNAFALATSTAGVSAKVPFVKYDTQNYRVGIGTSTPGATFSVAGNVLIQGSCSGCNSIVWKDTPVNLLSATAEGGFTTIDITAQVNSGDVAKAAILMASTSVSWNPAQSGARMGLLLRKTGSLLHVNSPQIVASPLGTDQIAYSSGMIIIELDATESFDWKTLKYGTATGATTVTAGLDLLGYVR